MSEAAEVGAVEAPGVARRRTLILITLTLVSLLYAMTVTLANVALPQMQGALGATSDQIAWVVTFNIVATAVATPIGGLADRAVRRRLIIGAIIGFTIASLLCGLAMSLNELVLYRVAQGCGAPLVPVCQAIVLDIYPKRQHGAVTAIFGMGVIWADHRAVIGGYLSDAFNWRWVFFMIIPFALLSLAGVWVFIFDRERPLAVRLDWTGFLALSLAVTSLQLMLDRGEREDWFTSTEILSYAGLALASLWVFIVQSLTAARPFLSPSLLRDRNYAVGIIIVTMFGMLNFTPMTLLPALLQNLRGYPDTIVGLLLATRGFGTLIGFGLLAFLSRRVDPRALIAVGFLLQAIAGSQMAHFDINMTMAGVAWATGLQGLGVGVVWVPVSLVAFSTLESRQIPEGTAVFHLLRNIGSSVHISLSVALMLHTGKMNYAQMTEHVSPFNENFLFDNIAGSWAMDSAAGLAALSGEITRQATMIGYINAFYLFTWTSVLVVPLVLLVRWKR
ncbi:MAG: DHA2 family efflux MFS transporter permease subunit [Gammaproteobacteria bacterium]